MESPSLRVAIIGCHRMLDRIRAPHNLAAAVHAVPNLTVVGVQDKDPVVRTRFCAAWSEVWPEVTAHAEYEAMLHATRPDLVIVANSPAGHREVVEAAIATGTRGILLDKPMATTLADCDRICAACERAGIAFALALDRRWSPVGERVRHALDQGLIGALHGVSLLGVPELISHGCHWLDVALGWCADAEPAWAMGAIDDTQDPLSRLDPPGRGLVGLANGVVITIATGGGAPVPTIEVQGTTGRLLVVNWYLKEQPTEAWVLPAALGEPVAGTRLRRLDLGAGDPSWPHGPRMVADLAARIIDGAPTACDTNRARRASEIGFALHASHRRGGARIAIPLAAGERGSVRVPGRPWGSDAVQMTSAEALR